MDEVGRASPDRYFFHSGDGSPAVETLQMTDVLRQRSNRSDLPQDGFTEFQT